MLTRAGVSALGLALISACGAGPQNEVPTESTTETVAEPLDAVALQTLLIEVEEGGIVELPEGTIELVDGLSLDVAGVTIRGAGQDKTILDFSSQDGAGEGLLITSDDDIPCFII